MTDQFDGDVAFILTPDGGQIIYTGGQPLMDPGGLENAVNISLFTALGYWANALNENEPDKQIGSDFEERARPKAITTAYLRDVEDAARDALQWMINQKIAQSVEAVATWPKLNQVWLMILITKPDGETVTVRYELNWEAGVLFPVTAKIEGIFFKSKPLPPLPELPPSWILATGFWNDGGFWRDGERWRDLP